MNKPLQQIDIIKIYETKRCLIVDDMTEVRAAYKRMLRSFGVREIDTAATGDQAMQMVENHQYGMIICDYNLDDSKDGQQVLEELRHMQMLKYTTLFVIITAETSREMVLGAIENQPDDYITKPISQKMMRMRLDRALIKHEQLYQIKSAMDSKSYGRAIKLCDEKIQADTRYRMDCLRYKAQLYWLMGEFEQAKGVYERVLQEKPFPWAKIGIARAMLHLGEDEGIEGMLKEIISNDHRYIEAHDLLSDYFQRKQQGAKAQNATQLATELSPKSITRHRRLAKLAEENGDDEVCIKAYEEAIRWNYNSCHADPEDYLSLARKTVDATKGRKDTESIKKIKKALGLLDRMVKRFPESKNKVKSGFIESQLHVNQGKRSLAQSAMELAEQQYALLEHKSFDTRLDYAQSNLALGDKHKAYKEMHLVAKQCKGDKKVLERIDRISEEPITLAGKQCAAELSKAGIEAYHNKDFDQAVTIFKDTLNMFPNHIGVNLNMVQVVLAKTENEGVSPQGFHYCKECLLKIGDIEKEHKQYSRHQFLLKQYQNLYRDYL
ncbi:MAG: response regulator [Cellvibrionaceae bacterium]|nr:response regulator [Cellvibrionaceae bacterium]